MVLYAGLLVSCDNEFIRLDQPRIRAPPTRQASPFLRRFWPRLINLISKDMIVKSIYWHLRIIVSCCRMILDYSKIGVKLETMEEDEMGVDRHKCHTYT